MQQTAGEKVLIVLKALAEDNRAIGPSELAKKLGMNKSTINRILMIMKKHGFVDQNHETRMYQLGLQAAIIGQAVTKSLEGQLATIVQPCIDQLRDQLGETIHFEAVSGNHIYLSNMAIGPGALKISLNIGDRALPNVHSGAKAIAAFSNPERVSRWLACGLPSFTDKTITQADVLLSQYEEIRKIGYAITHGEFDPNSVAIGVPVFNFKNEPVGAVVMIKPMFRGTKDNLEKIVSMIKETAGLISKRLLSSVDV